MFGLTYLGIAHTLVSLVALLAGALALARHGEIAWRLPPGRTYLVATVLAALSALGIFRHGGFGPPHGLALLTLLAVAMGSAAELRGAFGRWSHAVQTLSFSASLLFHMIPGVTESLTRLPPAQPVLPNADAPAFGPIYGVLLLCFLAGVAWQLRRQRRPVQPAAS